MQAAAHVRDVVGPVPRRFRSANDPVPRLYGTMLGPTESTALLRLDGRIAAPRLYRVGDRAGGYRVAEISERSVALVGPSGRLVLRLAQPDQ